MRLTNGVSEPSVSICMAGLDRALTWILGKIDGQSALVVIEGVGSYGAGLADRVTGAGLLVAEPSVMPAAERHGAGQDRCAGRGPHRALGIGPRYLTATLAAGHRPTGRAARSDGGGDRRLNRALTTVVNRGHRPHAHPLANQGLRSTPPCRRTHHQGDHAFIQALHHPTHSPAKLTALA